MPWEEATNMSLRKEFIHLARQENANVSALCRQFGISRKTGYKWLKRYDQEGESGLADHSRRPRRSPRKTEAGIEVQVLAVRCLHKAWGGRKIRKVLLNDGCHPVPAASTVTNILHRYEQIDPEEARKHKPFQRFEKDHPNEMWQMDFKGQFSLTAGGYCHPLTVLDDHSRFLLGLKACPNETIEVIKAQLTDIFRHFGLPERMLMDNGSAWGFNLKARHTVLTAWLIRLGIAISHGRPYHPQTQGKDERLHRTLSNEVIRQHRLATLQESQIVFDDWRRVYNYIRPHEALQLDTPAEHFSPSPRLFPETLPPVIYDPGDEIRKTDMSGNIYFHGRKFHISAAFRYQPLALRPAEQDGDFEVFYCKQKVALISLRHDNC